MVIGERLAERVRVAGLTYSELARRVGVKQPTITRLVNGGQYGSSHLHRIARELRTTPAYLTGEIDDPDEGAPPPLPEPQVVHVMLPVALPAKPALAAMFHGLLLSLGDWQKMPVDELSQELATLLPSGLGVLRGPLRFEQSADDGGRLERTEDHAISDRAPLRAQRR